MTAPLAHPDQHYGCLSYSQHGEDMVLANIFKLLNIEKPSYIDLGAHHPHVISNTKLLYDRGSRGVNVECNKNLIRAFEAERPRDANVCKAIALTDGIHSFYMFNEISGRNSCAVDEVLAYAKESAMSPRMVRDVEGVTLKELVDTHFDGKWPEFINCDVEGWDFEILEAAAWDESLTPFVVCVETRRHDSERMSTMMRGKAMYPLIRMGENIIYVRAHLMPRLMQGMGLGL